jgi:hypothetical protein
MKIDKISIGAAELILRDVGVNEDDIKAVLQAIGKLWLKTDIYAE